MEIQETKKGKIRKRDKRKYMINVSELLSSLAALFIAVLDGDSHP